MPGATISVSWELENFTSGFDNHSYYLQFYSNDLSELPEVPVLITSYQAYLLKNFQAIFNFIKRTPMKLTNLA